MGERRRGEERRGLITNAELRMGCDVTSDEMSDKIRLSEMSDLRLYCKVYSRKKMK